MPGGNGDALLRMNIGFFHLHSNHVYFHHFQTISFKNLCHFKLLHLNNRKCMFKALLDQMAHSPPPTSNVDSLRNFYGNFPSVQSFLLEHNIACGERGPIFWK